MAVARAADGQMEARVVNARACTMTREVFRHPDLANLVRLQRVRDHFICTYGTYAINNHPERFQELVLPVALFLIRAALSCICV